MLINMLKCNKGMSLLSKTVLAKTGTVIEKYICKDGKMAKVITLGNNPAKKSNNTLFPKPDQYLQIRNGNKIEELNLFSEGKQITVFGRSNFSPNDPIGRNDFKYVMDMTKPDDFRIWD